MSGLLVAGALAASLAAAGASAGPPDMRATHGAQLAERCAACHAIGPAGASRNGGAPPFHALRMRYNPIGLEQALKRISKYGHYEMRPLSLADSDAEDIAAYIASLQPGR